MVQQLPNLKIRRPLAMIFIHNARRYYYQLTVRARIVLWWRRLNSTPVKSTHLRILKKLSAQPTDSVMFVTYHPQGYISEHVKNYVANFKRLGLSIILIKIVDDINHPLADTLIPNVDAAMVRKNAGYDFGAWAHALQVFSEVYQGNTLWFVNDSVFGPVTEASFDYLHERIQNSDSDLIGLTESHQYIDHYQSFFLVFKNLTKHADKIRSYWSKVRNIEDKLTVIFEYELGLKNHFLGLGLRCCSLFPELNIPRDRNPSLYGWRELLNAGFPFLKVSLLGAHNSSIEQQARREMFCQLGYSNQLIDQHLRARNQMF